MNEDYIPIKKEMEGEIDADLLEEVFNAEVQAERQLVEEGTVAYRCPNCKRVVSSIVQFRQESYQDRFGSVSLSYVGHRNMNNTAYPDYKGSSQSHFACGECGEGIINEEGYIMHDQKELADYLYRTGQIEPFVVVRKSTPAKMIDVLDLTKIPFPMQRSGKSAVAMLSAKFGNPVGKEVILGGYPVGKEKECVD